MNLLRPGDRQILLNAAKATPFELLMTFLKLYGTPIIFAPYYDTSRTSTQTYDLNGGGDYLTLTGAIFDATDYQAMKFDGVDDYALGNAVPASSQAIYLAAVVKCAAPIDSGACILSYGNSYGSGLYELMHKNTDTNNIVYDTSPRICNNSYVGDSAVYMQHFTVSSNKLSGYINATAFDVSNDVTAGNKVDPVTPLRVSGRGGATTIDYKGSVHLALAIIGTNIQIDALKAKIADGTLYALVKAAFPWVSLP